MGRGRGRAASAHTGSRAGKLFPGLLSICVRGWKLEPRHPITIMDKHNLGHRSTVEREAGRRRALFPSPSSLQCLLGRVEIAMSHQPHTGAALPTSPGHSWLVKNELARGQAAPSQTPGELPGDTSLLTAKVGIKPWLGPVPCCHQAPAAEHQPLQRGCRCICRAPAPGSKSTMLTGSQGSFF